MLVHNVRFKARLVGERSVTLCAWELLHFGVDRLVALQVPLIDETFSASRTAENECRKLLVLFSHVSKNT